MDIFKSEKTTEYYIPRPGYNTVLGYKENIIETTSVPLVFPIEFGYLPNGSKVRLEDESFLVQKEYEKLAF